MGRNKSRRKSAQIFAICLVSALCIVAVTSISCTQQISKPPQLNLDLPHGTYTATALGFTQTATFGGNTLTMYDDIDGKRIFEYSFPNGIGSGKIQVRNVVTNEVGITPFKYNKQYDCVTIGKITYYK